jgi:cytochrome P450
MQIDYEPLRSRPSPDPYPVFAALRELDPIHWAPESQLHCISRYDDVVYVLRQPELFSSSAMQDVLMGSELRSLTLRNTFQLARFLWRAKVNPIALQKAGNLNTIDPPRHDLLRSIVNRGFTPRRIAVWEARAREIVSERLRVLDTRGSLDVIDDLAVPLPVSIIAEMLGIESARQPDFKTWSDAIVAMMSGAARSNPLASGLLDPIAELFGYLRGVVRARRRDPQDDLISVLVDPAQEGALSELDMVNFVVLLLVAGNETTTNLIGNAVNALLDHPHVLEQVAAEPSLVPALIEETLRFDSPIQLVFRRATRDVEIAGQPIASGSVVMPILASANRDGARFERPDELDLDRDPRGHLGFGLGVHFCLGASLARMEARVALEALVPELPRLKSTGRRDQMVDSFLVRGRRHLRLSAGTR